MLRRRVARQHRRHRSCHGSALGSSSRRQAYPLRVRQRSTLTRARRSRARACSTRAATCAPGGRGGAGLRWRRARCT
eukprot:3765868-Prymnesium_polylepis.1